MENKTPGIVEIYHYLVNTPELSHSVTDKYNGMHFTDFIKRFPWFTIKYPFKGDRKQFLIELQENGNNITCEMTDNICSNAYIIEND
ncbi:MAG: hypothetical protein LBS20_07210 [Prevotella sp.]|jgi:hypothetical protein|nr:hypothetical protein [Prevotella sp.]